MIKPIKVPNTNIRLNKDGGLEPLLVPQDNQGMTFKLISVKVYE